MEPLTTALAFCIPLTVGPIPEPKAVVDAFIEAYSSHDVEALAELMSADARITSTGFDETGEVVIGRYRDRVFKQFPTIRLRIVDQIFHGDTVAQMEEASAEGQSERLKTLSVYRVDRGCIVSMSYTQ